MKKILSLLLIISMTMGLTSCKAKLPMMGVIIYNYEDNFMSFIKPTIEGAAKDRVRLMMKDSKNDQGKQNDQVDTLISKKVDVLAVNLVNPGDATMVAEKAQKAGIPLIFFNREYPEGTDKIPYDKTAYVGTNSAHSGVIQGELIIDAWRENPSWDKNKDGKMQYVMLMGEPGHPDAEARTTESVGTVVGAGIQVEEVALQTGMWQAEKAKRLMERWLFVYGDTIEMVICNNDDMVVGAVETLEEAGYFSGDQYMPVVGVDGTPEVLELIRADQVLGTVLNDPLNQCRAIVELAINASLEKDMVEGTSWELDTTKAVRVPYVAITKDNLEIAEEAYGQTK